MRSRPARLLCVGNEPELLQTRCAVLIQSGYDAQWASLAEGETLLRTKEFDLMIVSARLSDWEKGRILTAAGKTPVYVLTDLSLADELLAQVERRLPAANSGPF
jgi:DNA-binding response OmpR family regulator